MGRAPQGARGLKSESMKESPTLLSRAPQGARGLKSVWTSGDDFAVASCPARGTWIEMRLWAARLRCALRVVPRKGHVD